MDNTNIFKKGHYYIFSKHRMVENLVSQGIIIHQDESDWASCMHGSVIYIENPKKCKARGSKDPSVMDWASLGEYFISRDWCREIDEVRFNKASGRHRYWIK